MRNLLHSSWAGSDIVSASHHIGAGRGDWDVIHATLAEAGGGNPALEWRWRHVFRLLNVDVLGDDVRFVDIGCGDGSFARQFFARYPSSRIAGVDGSREGVIHAREAIPGSIFHEVDLDADSQPDLPDLDGFGNVAVCTEVLEHLDNPVQGLKNARRHLCPGARVVLTVPAGPMSASDRYFGHRKHYTISALRHELESAGYDVEGIWAAGFPFHSLYRLVVVARGKQTIDDQIGSPGRLAKFLTKAAFAVFSALFRFNLFWPPIGWQIFAVARVPVGGTSQHHMR